MCSSSGGQLYEYNFWYNHSVLVAIRYAGKVRNWLLPVVLYGCETWSRTFKEERRLRVFENSVMRRIFGPKRDKVRGEWRRLHNEELNNVYSSTNSRYSGVQIEWNEMGGACCTHGGGEVRTGFW
jgi:hypothetical protein